MAAVLLAVTMSVTLASCGPKANPKEDFEWREGAQGISIEGYVGETKTVVIPRKINGKPVTEIDLRAFTNKTLTNVTIPNSVTEIGVNTFENNALTGVIIPNSITGIEYAAFKNNALTSVTIPNSVTTIESRAFENNALTSIAISDSVTEIGLRAFADNALTSVTIGANVPIVPRGVVSVFGSSNFENFYISSGKKAGTYTRPNAESADWTKQ
jgi:hypothetical protein